MDALPPYLTVKEAAAELGISDDAVRKLIRNQKLRAVKRSERRTLIPRPAFDAYLRKMRGDVRQIPGRTSSLASLAERSDAFAEDAGMSPEAWLRMQISDENRASDSSQSMGLTVSAYGLVSERRAEGLIDVPVEPHSDPERIQRTVVAAASLVGG